MRQRQTVVMRPTFRDDQITASFGMVRNPNKSLAWSSISSSHPNQQQAISALDYKVSNPSSSLVMSSLSNIYEHYQQQKDIQTKQSDEYEFNSGRNGASFGENEYMKKRGGNEEEANKHNHNNNNNSNNEFYKYLVANGQHMTNKNINITNKNINITNKSINNNKQPAQIRQYKQQLSYQPQNTSLTSMEQSLLHLQHSQEELSYLKHKLQQAYEKLQNEILHSYDLQQKIEILQQQLNRQQEESTLSRQQLEQLNQELEKKENLLMLQKRENEKLKFTLKTIIKNQQLREELSICESQTNLQNNSTSVLSSQSVNDSLLRENELKENLKMKLEIKEQQNVINKLKQTIQQLKVQNTKHSSQTKCKDKYLSQLMQQLQLSQQQLQQAKQQLQEMRKSVNSNNQNKHQQQIEGLVNEKKSLQLRQSQLTNKITILQQELRIVTDEKVTLMSRLKHQIALQQGQIQQLLQQNQAIKAINQQHFLAKQQFIDNHQNTNRNPDSLDYIAYSPNSISKNYPNNNNNTNTNNYNNNNYNNPLSVNKEPKTVQNYHQVPLIFDSQEEDTHNQNYLHSKTKNHSQTKIPMPNKRPRNFNPSDYQNKTHKSSKIPTNPPQQNNKENLMNYNNNNNQLQESQSYSQNELSKLQKSVGKWKRSHSQSISNNSSVYFEGNSNNSQSQNDPQHQQQSLYQEIGQRQLQMNMPPNDCATQKLIHSKLSLQPPQSQDQKLSKYQQHRKNLETELQSLQKIKRPTKQERDRIQKLQKQLYYVDSDIAGLKRKIRRKY